MKKLILILILALLAVFILQGSANASSPDMATVEKNTPEIKESYVFPETGEQSNSIRIGIY